MARLRRSGHRAAKPQPSACTLTCHSSARSATRSSAARPVRCARHGRTPDDASVAARRAPAAYAPLRRALRCPRHGTAVTRRGLHQPPSRSTAQDVVSCGVEVARRALAAASSMPKKVLDSARARTRAKPAQGAAGAAARMNACMREKQISAERRQAAHHRHGWAAERGYAPAAGGSPRCRALVEAQDHRLASLCEFPRSLRLPTMGATSTS